MTKKKLIITITSLCLVVVAAVAAVVGIVAATQVNIASKLTVSYTPNSAVYAEINAFYIKDKESETTPIGSQLTYDYNKAINQESSVTLDDQVVELSDTVTWVIFGFSFKNTVNVADNPNAALLTVAAAHHGTTTGTMDVYVGYTKEALTGANLTPAKVQALTDKTGTSLSEMTSGTTGYAYVAIARQAGKQGSYAPAQGGSTFAFSLSAKNATPAA